MNKDLPIIIFLILLGLLNIFNYAGTIYENYNTRLTNNELKKEIPCSKAWNCDDNFHIENIKRILGQNYTRKLPYYTKETQQLKITELPESYFNNYPNQGHIISAIFVKLLGTSPRISFLITITIITIINIIISVLILRIFKKNNLTLLIFFYLLCIDNSHSSFKTFFIAVGTLSRSILMIFFLTALHEGLRGKKLNVIIICFFGLFVHSHALFLLIPVCIILIFIPKDFLILFLWAFFLLFIKFNFINFFVGKTSSLFLFVWILDYLLLFTIIEHFNNLKKLFGGEKIETRERNLFWN